MATQPIFNLLTDSLVPAGLPSAQLQVLPTDLANFLPTLLPTSLAQMLAVADASLPKGDLLMPPSASNFSDGIDFTFWLIFWVSTVCTVGIGALMVLFPIMYRQKDKQKVAHGKTHSTPLEIAWTLPPLIAVLVFFVFGFVQYVDMVEAPDDATEIDVIAYQWAWDFYYPEGQKANMGTGLHLLAGENYRFNLAAKDVLHSFYIPQFRIKKDCVPGRETMCWVRPKTAEEMGLEPPADGSPWEFDLYCTEYCGTGHSNMNVVVYVHHSRESYDEALSDLGGPPAGLNWIQWGENLMAANGCASCHSLDGSPGNGPTWQNIVGESHAYTDGSNVLFDYDHMVESIANPQKLIRSGYAGVNMAAYQLSTAQNDAFYALMAEKSGKLEPWMDKPIRDEDGNILGVTRKAWLDAGSPDDVTDLLGQEANYDSSDAAEAPAEQAPAEQAPAAPAE